MSTFTAVVVSHNNPVGLRKILGNLLYQTRRPDETLVFVSMLDRATFARFAEEFPWATFYEEDDRDDWGHHKRGAGVERATSDYLGFFNDDDSYHNSYIERLMGVAENRDACAVYCDWTGIGSCEFRSGSSTSGNFIVKTGLARLVGYPDSREYDNDGVFINRCADNALLVGKVPDCLYFHNRQD